MLYKVYRPSRLLASQFNGTIVNEARIIDGRPALVQYEPRGGRRGVQVMIFDPRSGMEYRVSGYDHTLRGSNDNAVIAIARSLYRTEAP